MIKATATGPNGRKLVVFGLSYKNLDRLKEDKPIRIHAEEIGMSGFDIMIFAGKDEATMAKMLKPFINEQTIVHDLSKEKKQ